MIEFPTSPVTGQTETIDGIKWICEVGATGANADPDNVVWVRQGNALSEAQPIGSFINFGGTVAPAGYLVCDGSEVSQTTYADLFAAIGTAWNTTAGATPPAGGNFRLPPQNVDGLGLFMRGDGSGTVVGEYQADVFKEHTHPNISGFFKVGPYYTTDSNAGSNTGTVASNSGGDIGDMGVGTGSDPTETRPRSITTLLCIKATYSAYTGDLGNLPVNSVDTPQIVTDAVKEDALDVNALQVAGLLPTVWVQFDGTLVNGTMTGVKGSYNVSSVSKSGAGNYTVNFGSMDNSNYSVQVSSLVITTGINNLTTNSCGVVSRDTTHVLVDSSVVTMQVFGGRT